MGYGSHGKSFRVPFGILGLNTFIWQGLFGFLICVATLFSIKVTSPITHMVSSAVRGVIQTFFSVWIFHDIISLYVFLCHLVATRAHPFVAQWAGDVNHPHSCRFDLLHMGQTRGGAEKRVAAVLADRLVGAVWVRACAHGGSQGASQCERRATQRWPVGQTGLENVYRRCMLE